MTIRIGSIAPSAIYLGSTAIARVYLGSTLVYEAAQAGRVPIADTDTILFAGHSFVQTAYGAPAGEEAEPFGGILQADWPGTALSDYAGYASMATIRALDGHLLNSSWDAAIISEFTNPLGPGFADFDSAQGRETLQNAYWDAMDAQRAGGEIIIQDIWPPQGRTDLYANATGFSQGLREWLEAHTGRKVWIIPAFPFVEAMRTAYGDAIYGDGLHLVRGNSPYPRGMSYLVYSFLTQQRCPFVRAGDEAIDQMAWDTLQAYECAGMGGSIRYTSTLPSTDPLPSPEPLPSVGPTLKPGTLTNPGLGMLLNWDGPDAVNNNPFVDWLKLGSEWLTSGATAMDWAALLSAGHITANGAINSIPAGADNIRMRLLSHIPSGPATGRYRLYFTGDGSIGFSGAGAVDWPAAGRAEFDYTANGSSFVDLLVSGVTSQITFNALVHEDDWAAYEAGEMFRPAWLDLIRNMRVIRFTDWMATDYRTGVATWATRYTPGRITYQGGEGVPVEVMCQLCNEIGADPWFSLLSGVDDTYVTAFATAARSTLNAERHVYVELSNKIWDGANWATANYFRDLALDWFSDGGIEACMEAYGGRSSEVFDAWRAAWSGGNSGRVHTVLQAWTPNAYISEFAMTAPRWVALQSGRVAPYTKATEWALHANLDGGMRYEDSEHPDVITTIQGWIDTLPQSDVFANMADAMRNGNPAIGSGYTMAGLASAYSDQKNLLAYYGNTLNPICYEGGSHLAVPPSKNGDVEWVDTFVAFHQSAQWADVWSDSITETWYGAFGAESFYVRKNDVRLPDANNGYGLMRWASDTTGNLQLAEWQSLQSARNGETGRGADDFIGTYEETE